MPFTFQDRVEDYVGNVTDTGALSDWLIAGARRLVDLLPRQKLLRFVKPTVLNAGQETSIDQERIVYITTSAGIEVPPVSNPADYGKYTTAASLHFAPATDPRYIFSDGKVKIVPATVAGVMHSIPYPSDPFHYLTEIPNFPIEAEELVVLYASVQVQNKKLSDIITSLLALTITAPTAPVAPEFTMDELMSLFALPTLSTATEFGAVSGIGHVLDAEQDLELTTGKLGQITQLINEYRAKVEGEAAESVDNIGVYRTNLDSYRAQVEAYSSSIAGYQAELRVQTESYLARVQQYNTQVQVLVASIASLSKEYRDALALILGGGLPGDNKASA